MLCSLAPHYVRGISLGNDFYRAVEKLSDDALKLRWYYCVIVNLAAINYPDVIPEVWKHCWQHLCEPLDHDGRFAVAQKTREALTKGCGIMGPAKVRYCDVINIYDAG